MSSFRKWRLASGILCTTLAGAPLTFRTRDLPWAAFGTEYRTTIQTQVDGRCPLSDVSLSVVEGVLPKGLAIEGGVLTGVPKEMGTFHLRIRGANVCGAVEREYLLEVTGKPILRVVPDELVFEYRIGDPAPQPQTLRVAGTWPELPYSVSAAASWLHLSLSTGVTPSAGSAFSADPATVTIMPKDLAPGRYETTLVFSAPGAATAPAIPVKLRILPAAGN
jgi:hypothetical protein